MEKSKFQDNLIVELAKDLMAGKPLTRDEFLRYFSRKSVNNWRNGKGRKNLSSSLGSLEVFTPRDRLGSFSPGTIKKRQRQITENIDSKIISLYGRGMSYRDVAIVIFNK